MPELMLAQRSFLDALDGAIIEVWSHRPMRELLLGLFVLAAGAWLIVILSPGLLIAAIVAMLYCAPSLIALDSVGPIGGLVALNLLLGWTCIAWLAALIWALSKPRIASR